MFCNTVQLEGKDCPCGLASRPEFGGLDGLRLFWSIPYARGLMFLTLPNLKDIGTREHPSASN